MDNSASTSFARRHVKWSNYVTR